MLSKASDSLPGANLRWAHGVAPFPLIDLGWITDRTLVEDLSYEGLAVSNGEVAMLRYGEAVWGDLPAVERAAIFEDLLRYCGVDTLGMVRVFEVLERNC
jgi:hypothetical protein